jgi:L-amino acid N-acyltransferase YncA
MKLYADYLKEREDIDCIYDENCFIVFKKISEKTAFVYDTYSKKECRGKGIMLDFFKKFCIDLKERNVDTVYVTTVESTNGWENSDRLLRKFGFVFMGKDPKNKDINNYYLEI